MLKVVRYPMNKNKTKKEQPIKKVKTVKLEYKSKIFEAVHSSAQGLYESGAIDQVTMQDFDVRCLAKTKRRQQIILDKSK